MRKVLLTVACWATISLASAQANVDYRYVADAASYTGTVGSTVAVNLYLQETVTGTSQSIIFNDKGMFGAGVMVLSPGGAIFGTAGDFKIVGNTTGSPNGFGVAGGLIDQSPATAVKTGLIINSDVTGTANPGPTVPTSGAAVNKILLGTLNVKVGAATTTLTVTPYGGGSNTITQAATDLDFGTQALNGYTGTTNNPLGNFNFTVGAAIPEPGSMALCGLAACGMGFAGYRRRKMAVSEPATVA